MWHEENTGYLTHPGFYNKWLGFIATGETLINLGQIYLRDKSMLVEVVVEAERAPVTVDGPTFEI